MTTATRLREALSRIATDTKVSIQDGVTGPYFLIERGDSFWLTHDPGRASELYFIVCRLQPPAPDSVQPRARNSAGVPE